MDGDGFSSQNYNNYLDLDMSIQGGQPNIKERLNHVLKRRLQENAPGPLSFENNSYISTTTSNNDNYQSGTSGLLSPDTKLNESRSNPQTPTKRTKRSPKVVKNNNTLITSRSAPTTPTNRSIAPLFYDSASRDGLSDSTITPPGNSNQVSTITSTKDKNQQPDILSQILNQKKLSLLRDPDVIQFLNQVTNDINLSKNSIS